MDVFDRISRIYHVLHHWFKETMQPIQRSNSLSHHFFSFAIEIYAEKLNDDIYFNLLQQISNVTCFFCCKKITRLNSGFIKFRLIKWINFKGKFNIKHEKYTIQNTAKHNSRLFCYKLFACRKILEISYKYFWLLWNEQTIFIFYLYKQTLDRTYILYIKIHRWIKMSQNRYEINVSCAKQTLRILYTQTHK